MESVFVTQLFNYIPIPNYIANELYCH